MEKYAPKCLTAHPTGVIHVLTEVRRIPSFENNFSVYVLLKPYASQYIVAVDKVLS